ncbi:putative mitochondrial protein [Phytophthora megakarya]|uniref:Putative mitochondrial protein n=1 Tax=Phytophthora megakarya TaxID=4795 RepID=A0A225VM49_9STRA|nr:putative mitochondrial protein [Phytophthora megakarya]
MAHDGSSDDESTFLDAQESTVDDPMPIEPKLPVEVELSPSSSVTSPVKSSSPVLNGRPKAVSAAPTPISLSINGQDTGGGSNESLRAFWAAQRRTQSVGNLRVENPSIPVNSAGSGPYLASPAHSESALLVKGGAPPPPPISVRPTVDTKPNGFAAMKDSLLAGMADFAGNKSPRGSMQKVHVVYPTPGPLFVDLYSRDDGTGALVKGFRRKPDGSMADTEASGRVYPGDELVTINSVQVTKMVFADIIIAAKEATFPLTLIFHCYLKNREEHDKLVQPPMDRKLSSGPLPPVSPSSNAGWSARLSQMTRSGSFDQKTSAKDLSNGVPRSPSSNSTSETNGGKFGFSLGKVGTDGVKKNLFRMMGNKPSRPEEDKNVVKGWMNDLTLKPHNNSSGGRHRKVPVNANADVVHTTPIMPVTTGGRFVGVLDDDVNEFALTWFRKTPPEMDIRQIKGVTRSPYFPSADDVGAILSLQCESLRFPEFNRVVEMTSPLVLDPKVGSTVDVLLEAGAGSFSATLASNEHDSFQIKISTESVTLVKISEDEDECGVVVNADYSTFLQILLDPADQLRFILKVQEFGGFLGNREGDICDLKNNQMQLKTLSCFFLVAQNREHRDILTLLIRKSRSRVVTPEQEEQAELDERNLFMDPAFVINVPPPPPLTASQSVGSNSGVKSPGNHSVVTASSNGIFAADNSFVEGRVAAQDKEIVMLREKLASMSVLLKTAEQENKQLNSSLEVKDNRIELQQMKIRQLEKFPGMCDSQAREIQTLRTKLEDEEKRYASCREELQHMSSAAAKRAAEMQDQGVQTEAKFLDGDACADAIVAPGSGWERDAWSGTVATISASDLQQQIKDQKSQIARLQDEQVKLVGERNMFRAKSMELSRELRKLVGANNNRPLDDLESQLAERTNLETKLASVKAEATRSANEVAEMKSMLDNVGDKDKGTKRLAAQNLELQRTVHQLKDSLSEARDQVDAVKKINSALASRLHRLQPETRGSTTEPPPTSPANSLPVFTSDDEDDDDDDEDEDEDEELKDGIAAFRRSLVGK